MEQTLNTLPQHILPSLHQISQLPIPPKNAVLVVPIGGCAQIGMNATLYGLDGQWMLVDAGIGLGAQNLNGLNAQVPDPRSLLGLRNRLQGVFITHAHEDHIGALPLLQPMLQCPIYAGGYAASILERRFKARNIPVNIQRFMPGDRVKIGPFVLQTIPVTHSVPDSMAFCMNTPVGNILHSGDWKMNPNAILGRGTDRKILRDLGDKGVRLLVSESTNATTEGFAGCETSVALELKRLCAETSGMIVLAGFASNIDRICAATWAGLRTNRHIGIVGRSLEEAIAAGVERGFITHPDAFLDPTMLARHPRSRRMLLATGAQGEERAGLDRLLRGDLPLHVSSGDAIILSARSIPGNETNIARLKQRAEGMGCKVWTKEEAPVHVSGHACREDMQEMYNLLRPRALLTIHGGPEQLEAQAILAAECNISSIPPMMDGIIHRVGKHAIIPLAQLKLQRWGSNGRRMMPIKSKITPRAHIRARHQSHTNALFYSKTS